MQVSYPSSNSRCPEAKYLLLPGMSRQSLLLRLYFAGFTFKGRGPGRTAIALECWQPRRVHPIWKDRPDKLPDDGNHNSELYKPVRGVEFLSPTLRICPTCLTEHGYHTLLFQLPGATTCPFHGDDLTETCPKTNDPIGELSDIDALIKYVSRSSTSQRSWPTPADESAEQLIWEKAPGLIESVRDRLERFQALSKEMKLFGCAVNPRSAQTIRAVQYLAGLCGEFSWCQNAGPAFDDLYEAIPLPRTRRSTSKRRVGYVTDDWRIFGNSVEDRRWVGAHFPIHEWPEFLEVAVEIRKWLGQHAEIINSLESDQPQCIYVVAFAAWFTLWTDPADGYYAHVYKQQESLAQGHPLVARTTGAVRELYIDLWPDDVPPYEKITRSRFCSQILKSCLVGSFNEIVLHAEGLARKGYVDEDKGLAPMRDGRAIYIPRRSAVLSNSSDEIDLKISPTSLLRIFWMSDHSAGRFYSARTIEPVEFHGINFARFR